MAKTHISLSLDEHMVSSYVDTRFGSLHYVGPPERQGEEVILFLHGFGSNWSIWLPLIRAARANGLLTTQDVLMIDLPSFGESENHLKSLRSRDVGEELLGVTENLGYKRVRIAGHSMGGFLAMDIAAFSSKIISVHLVAGTYLKLIRVVNDPLRGLIESPRITLFYGLQQLVSQSDMLARSINAVRSRSTKHHSHVYQMGGKSFRYASRNGLGYDAPKIWSSISIPIFAVFGSRDKLVTESDMNEFHTILPHAHLTLIEGGGHSLLISHAAEAAAALFSAI